MGLIQFLSQGTQEPAETEIHTWIEHLQGWTALSRSQRFEARIRNSFHCWVMWRGQQKRKRNFSTPKKTKERRHSHVKILFQSMAGPAS